MANINISQLPNLSPLTAAAVLPVDSGGSTYHVTAANLATYINTNAGNIIPALDNTYFLGNSTNRWANLWLGPGTLYITDSNIASNVTAALTVTDGVLLINGVNQQQVGQLKFVDNIIESTTGNIPIQIGLTTSSANLLLNRNTVLAAGKTLGLVDTANTANVATLSVTNGVLNIGNVAQLQAPGIANGNANIAISNTGNVTITTLPGSTPLQWIFDNTGNLRCASVTEQDNLIGENNGDFFMSGTQSVKMGAGLDGNLILTVNSANVEVGAGRNYTDQFNVYGTMHAVFDNIYETGGDITADKNVYVGRLTVSNQPGDPNIPGITANSTSTDFSLGVLNDTGNLVINRNVIRNGNHGATDTITNYSPDVPVGVNTPYEFYAAADATIIGAELLVTLQYGTTGDTDTELSSLLVTKNANGDANLVVVSQSCTATGFSPAAYTASVAGGVITVSVQTSADSSAAYYRYRATEFGGYYGA